MNAILLRLILSVTTGMCEEILGCFGHSGELLLHDSVLELLVATVLLAKDVTAERYLVLLQQHIIISVEPVRNAVGPV